MTSAIAAALPTWAMTTIYPGVDSPEYDASVGEFKRLIAGIDASLTKAEGLGETSGEEVTRLYEELASQVEDALEVGSRNMAFLYGYIAVDSRTQEAQARNSELEIVFAELSKCSTRLTAWIGTLDIDALLSASEVARSQEFLLRQAKTSAEHLMHQDLEALASDLTLSGGLAWGRLHEDVTSQIMVPFEREDGTVDELPMTEIRNLATNPDREVRKRAYEAELKAWELWQTPIAAALNGIKGEHTTIATRQQWDSILDQALFQNHIDRKTLDAMMEAAREAFPDIRRYFDAKAKALGVEKLAFYDLFAPLDTEGKAWEWDEGFAFVADQFGAYSPKMRGLAERALEERWIDVAPRPGKVGGAFCMPIRSDESRVLLNYTPSFSEVRTLAHELGHAYHNLCQVDVPATRRAETPMTLAETASTFCETILTQAAIAEGSEDEQLSYLESSLQDAAQIVVDISSRFLFEQAVCEKRRERTLSAEEFSELMLDAQRQTYGDGLDPEALHKYMWAAKGHYYSPRFAFYNYPYMFGLLFGLGLYAQFQADPDAFRANYDALLAATGDADAATLAATFGIDIQSKSFWESSLNVIRKDVDTFVQLVERRLA